MSKKLDWERGAKRTKMQEQGVESVGSSIIRPDTFTPPEDLKPQERQTNERKFLPPAQVEHEPVLIKTKYPLFKQPSKTTLRRRKTKEEKRRMEKLRRQGRIKSISQG